jgi:hypothetical protein
MLPYLGEFAREYTIEELNKVITKSLPPKAYGKYCGDGGDDLDDEDEILELLSMIDTKLDLKAEVAFLERKENPKLNNSDRKSDKKMGKQNNGREGGKSKEDKAKPCFKHDGKHDWRDCPDNKNREWTFPGFGVPKSNGTIHFVIDFRRINANLVCREFPLWTTEEILTSIKGFTYATSIDLNMGYPSIPLNDESKKILTIVMPFGAFEYLTLPMGVMPASDLFQARMVHTSRQWVTNALSHISMISCISREQRLRNTSRYSINFSC